MKKIRIAAGALLVLLALGALVYWELEGREAVMFQEVLVAKEAIPAGVPVQAALFTTVGLPAEGRQQGALAEKDAAGLEGLVAAHAIQPGSQVSMADFQEAGLYMEDGKSIFVLKPEWIAMRSSALRRGDLVEIYENRGHTLLGAYRVAFVKDAGELEVKDLEFAGEQPPLERTDSTGVINHVEIITDIMGYGKITAWTEAPEPAGLLLVQKEE